MPQPRTVLSACRPACFARPRLPGPRPIETSDAGATVDVRRRRIPDAIVRAEHHGRRHDVRHARALPRRRRDADLRRAVRRGDGPRPRRLQPRLRCQSSACTRHLLRPRAQRRRRRWPTARSISPGFSTGVESYEYSKQPMNNLAFESGAGTVARLRAARSTRRGATGAGARCSARAAGSSTSRRGSNAVERASFTRDGRRPTTRSAGPASGRRCSRSRSSTRRSMPTQRVDAAARSAPTTTPARAARSSAPTTSATPRRCTCRIARRSRSRRSTPGADGFAGWKYGALGPQLPAGHARLDGGRGRHRAATSSSRSSARRATRSSAPTTRARRPSPGTFLGSSDIEGFQAQMFIQMLDNRAEQWLTQLTTTDGATLAGFASLSDALAYDYAAPLRWFPARSRSPRPTTAAASRSRRLRARVARQRPARSRRACSARTRASTRSPITPTRDVGGAQPALAYFDGDPFPVRRPARRRRADAARPRARDDARRARRTRSAARRSRDGAPRRRRRARGRRRRARHDALDDVGRVRAARAAHGAARARLAARAVLEQHARHARACRRRSMRFPPLDGATFARAPRRSSSRRCRASSRPAHRRDGRAYGGWDVATSAPDRRRLDASTRTPPRSAACSPRTSRPATRSTAIARSRVFERLESAFYDPSARIYRPTAGAASTHGRVHAAALRAPAERAARHVRARRGAPGQRGAASRSSRTASRA